MTGVAWRLELDHSVRYPAYARAAFTVGKSARTFLLPV